MIKKLSITIPEWVYNEYLSDIKSNRSAFIVDMLVKGIKLETGEIKETQSKVAKLSQEIRNKEEENKKLKLTIENYKSKYDKKLQSELKEYGVTTKEELEEKKEQLEKTKSFLKSLRAASVLSWNNKK